VQCQRRIGKTAEAMPTPPDPAMSHKNSGHESAIEMKKRLRIPFGSPSRFFSSARTPWRAVARRKKKKT
jgi:hypothetical protein